jgi:cytochrome c oxidase subunit 3
MANVSDTAERGHARRSRRSRHAHPDFLQHHFDTPTQQFAASKLGMWVFIATEILMFGGLFCAYAIWRGARAGHLRPGAPLPEQDHGRTNTVVLLFSSLTAALAVRSAQVGKRNLTSAYLVVTILCACVFLVVKYFEYAHKIHLGLLPGHCFGHPVSADRSRTARSRHVPADPRRSPAGNPEWVKAVDEEGHVQLLPPRANMFFAIYFVMTGLHGCTSSSA